jgi:GNAT superfamily N-acetyltransferase
VAGEYRPGQRADALALTQVWAESFGELAKRHGFEGPSPVTAGNPLYEFTAEHAPDGFWVAEEGGQPIGFTISFVHGSCWYLSSLFIRPGHQNQGLGRGLMERALQTEQPAGTTNRALVTFAYNPTSISLYLRYGLYPREPLYAVAGAPAAVRVRLGKGDPTLSSQVLSFNPAAVAQFEGIDEQAVGLRRDLVARYVLTRPDGSCHLFRRDGAVVGYAFVGQNGRVGPVAVASPTDLEAVFRAALGIAAQQESAAQITAIIPGSNEAAVRVALDTDLRIVAPFLFMSARPLAGWGSYLLHSPGVM